MSVATSKSKKNEKSVYPHVTWHLEGGGRGIASNSFLHILVFTTSTCTVSLERVVGARRARAPYSTAFSRHPPRACSVLCAANAGGLFAAQFFCRRLPESELLRPVLSPFFLFSLLFSRSALVASHRFARCCVALHSPSTLTGIHPRILTFVSL